MTEIFLNKRDIISYDNEDIDGEISTVYISLNIFAMSKFKNINNGFNIIIPLISMGYRDYYNLNHDHRIYKDCELICLGKKEIIFKLPSYTVNNVKISDYRKSKINNFLNI